MKYLTIIIFLFSFSSFAAASGGHLLDTAYLHLEKGEYYNTITETMRYRYLYPSGERYSESLMLEGRAYAGGGDAGRAIALFQESYRTYPDSYYGQQGLLYLGLVRLINGSTAFALNNFQEYNFIYKEGYFYEDSLFYLCAARALSEQYNEAQSLLEYYKDIFPEGNYIERADALSAMIKDEQERPAKSPFIAALSSAIVPGLGYVYTEKYLLGLFSFATNGLLVYMIYDGYRKKNEFQMIFFSIIELSFYNYAIIGSIQSAHEYNDSASFKREVIMGIKKTF